MEQEIDLKQKEKGCNFILWKLKEGKELDQKCGIRSKMGFAMEIEGTNLFCENEALMQAGETLLKCTGKPLEVLPINKSRL